MIFSYTFPTKHRQMIRTIKMLHSLIMLFTEKAFNTIVIIKIDISQYTITFDNFIQDIEIQRELIDTLNLFYKFSADWTSNSIVSMKGCETFSAESVAAMNENPWNFLSYIEFFTAKITVVEASSFVISLQKIFRSVALLFLF